MLEGALNTARWLQRVPKWLWLAVAVFVGVLAILVYGLAAKAKRYVRKIKLRKKRAQQCALSDTLSDTIFVSVPCYRDQDCAATLLSLFNNAKCPHRVFVGLLVQNTSGDTDVLEEFRRLTTLHDCDLFTDQIRAMYMDASEARGPMYARAIIEQQLYRDERWYLTVDSHMRFASDWDQHFIDMTRETAQHYGTALDKVVLTMYPHDVEHEAPAETPFEKLPAGSFMRVKRFNAQHGMLQLEGPLFVKKPPRPLPSTFVAVGCCFSSATRLRECPFDPNFDFVFLGEETSMGLRLWTHGYDFYNPATMIVWHRWSRDYRPTFWENLRDKRRFPESVLKERQFRNRVGLERMWGLFRMHNGEYASKAPTAPYGLGSYVDGEGNARTFEAYERFCGVNWQQQSATREAWMGLFGKGCDSVVECTAKYGPNRSDVTSANKNALERARGRVWTLPTNGTIAVAAASP
jgi:hypothetical protein